MALEAVINNDIPRWSPLYEAVKDASQGDMFTYAKLQSITGINIKKDRDVIYTVNKELLSDGSSILINVRNQGYKVSCSDTQIIHATGRKTKASNQLRMCKTELIAINPKTVSSEKKIELTHFINRVNTGLNIIEGKAASGLKKTQESIKDQEENLSAIRKMKANLVELEARFVSVN